MGFRVEGLGNPKPCTNFGLFTLDLYPKQIMVSSGYVKSLKSISCHCQRFCANCIKAVICCRVWIPLLCHNEQLTQVDYEFEWTPISITENNNDSERTWLHLHQVFRLQFFSFLKGGPTSEEDNWLHKSFQYLAIVGPCLIIVSNVV